MNRLKLFTSILIVLIFTNCNQNKSNTVSEPKTAKYVFYFIGDGMGMAQVALTEMYLSAKENNIGVHKLTMSEFPVFGIASTYAEDRLITGSAASGTALASGHKTSINTIGLAANHTDTLYSLAHLAKLAGLKVGILSSVGINHATPAAFYAHQEHRNQYYQIAMQLHKSNFDVFAGGGFIDPNGKNNDLEDAYEITKKNGYKIYNNVADFKNLSPNENKVMLVSPDILSQAELPYMIDRKTDDYYSLADFTKKSIELLDNPKGFFMMIEGGKIDWASHSNDAYATIGEVIDFDNAIKTAYDFYLQHPDETLIIVTADHETGGLSLGWNKMKYESNLQILDNQKYSYDLLLDTFNTIFNEKTPLTESKINNFFEKYFGIPTNNLKFDKCNGLKNSLFITSLESNLEQRNIEIFRHLLAVFNQQAGINWTTHSHTCVHVPVRAIGVGSQNFDGFYDNTDIYKKIEEIMKLKN